MQFSRLRQLITTTKAEKPGDEDSVSMSASTFMSILHAALYASPMFNEASYNADHPDIVAAIMRGEIPSAIEHFVKTGYFQDALPGNIVIDENFYLSENRDIALAFRKGQIKDLQKHFEVQGYTEGRLPYAKYSVWGRV